MLDRRVTMSNQRRKFHAARFAAFFKFPDPPDAWTRPFLWTSIGLHEIQAVHAMHSRVLISLTQTGRAIGRGHHGPTQ